MKILSLRRTHFFLMDEFFMQWFSSCCQVRPWAHRLKTNKWIQFKVWYSISFCWDFVVSTESWKKKRWGWHNFESNNIMYSTMSYCYPRLYREAIDIHKHWNSFIKKDEGLIPNKVCHLALRWARNKELTPTEPEFTATAAQKFNNQNIAVSRNPVPAYH